jgi:hypothetical protein
LTAEGAEGAEEEKREMFTHSERVVISIPVASELILPEIRTRQKSGHGRNQDTAEIRTRQKSGHGRNQDTAEIRTRQCRVPTINLA